MAKNLFQVIGFIQFSFFFPFLKRKIFSDGAFSGRKSDFPHLTWYLNESDQEKNLKIWAEK